MKRTIVAIVEYNYNTPMFSAPVELRTTA